MEENKIIEWPADLYKYRCLNGMGHYKHIEGNVYEDMTCKDHPNCRISVKQVDDHFEFDECVNESAREYKWLHTYMGGDSQYYPDDKTPLRIVTERWIREYEGKIPELHSQIEECEKSLVGVKEIEYDKQCIESLDFGDMVFLMRRNTKDRAVAKVNIKSYCNTGLCHIVAGGYTLTNTSDGSYIKAEIEEWDYDDHYTSEWEAFTSEEARDAFINNCERKKIADELEGLRKQLAYNEKHLGELRETYAKYL